MGGSIRSKENLFRWGTMRFAMSGCSINRASVGCDCKFNPLALGQIQNGAETHPRGDIGKEARHGRFALRHRWWNKIVSDNCAAAFTENGKSLLLTIS
jgi:hypothetical protein